MPERILNFDINNLQQRAYVGVRRAAAFLGMSGRFLEGEFPNSLTLGSSIKRQFLPDPFPSELIPELRENWETWITGNALRELAKFLSLFLDDAFDIVQQGRMVSGEKPVNYTWRRIERITNVADKHQQVLGAANRFAAPHLDDHECLASLSNARNCLSHDLGIVTAKRAVDGELAVKWLALQMMAEVGGKTYIINEADMPWKNPDDDSEGARIGIQVVKVERRFALDTHIRFTPDNLLDICLFYQITIGRVAQAMVDYCRECGVNFPSPPAGSSSDQTAA